MRSQHWPLAAEPGIGLCLFSQQQQQPPYTKGHPVTSSFSALSGYQEFPSGYLHWTPDRD
ncbi:Hypothetical predicted protein, partial [Marmota monax]